jgi:DNA-binding NarL/FixJ family response regulator
MRFPQIVIYESDGLLAGLLRDQARDHQWLVREAQSSESVLRLLRPGGSSVVLLKVGPDLAGEMQLLERCGRLFPDAPVIVVSDTEHPGLTSLAWDLGARAVLGPPQPREALPEVVAGLMEAALRP